MSASLARLRKRAAELEQKKQFDRALEVYVQILDEGGKDLGDEDVPLFNRVGDMLMRKGSVTEALGYYERAVDMYAERGYLNNAIALCSKILRQSPGRAPVYYKLARISAKKGFKSDARKNFLEYADRMQKLGMADEAFRALKEFASLYPDQDDVRLVLAELLSKENRKGEAIEQLQSLYEKLQSEGRAAEARATVDRMRAIDPSVTPRAGTEKIPAQPSDLVFLDLSDAEPPVSTPTAGNTSQPVSARAPIPTPIPALTGLSITFFPDEEPTRPEGFETTSVLPDQIEKAEAHSAPEEFEFVERPDDTLEKEMERAATQPEPTFVEDVHEPPQSADPFELVDLDPPTSESEEIDVIDLPESDAETLTEGVTESAVQPSRPEEFTVMTEESPVPTEESLVATGESLIPTEESLIATEASQVAIEESRVASEESPVVTTEATTDRSTTPMSGLEFAGIELEETPTMAPARAHDLALPGQLPVTPEDLEVVAGPSPASDAAVDDARAAAEEAADIAADIAAREAAQLVVASIPTTPATLDEESAPPPPPDESAFDALDLIGVEAAAEANASLPDDFLSSPPSFGRNETPEEEHAFPPLFGLAESSGTPEDNVAAPEPELPPEEIETALQPIKPQTYVPTPPVGTISIGSAEDHIRRRLELDPENYDLRRQLGEALLDSGDRDGGLQELELAMAGFELAGDMDRAHEVVDEILRVTPSSILHHQKRVEFAVRSRDRGRLTSSYLELADALFRTGAGDKAVAVYGRVLELNPGNERAEFALSTLAPEELARLRGIPARPERWSDELNAIQPDAARQAAADVPNEVAQETVATEAPVAEPTVAESSEQSPSTAITLPTADAPIDLLELPNPDWGEGVPTPTSSASTASEEAEEMEAASESSDVASEEFAGSVAESLDGANVAQEAHDQLIADTTSSLDETPFVVDEAPVAPRAPTPRAATPVDFVRQPTPRAPTPIQPPRVPTPRATTSIAQPRVPTPRAPTPAAPPRTPTPMSSPRMETPVAPPHIRTPIAPPRLPTPRASTPVTVARITPRPEIPVSSDADFVDLGEWLRDTEPTRSTRMQVESPKPTGDEQADFDELLRRFKRGVAENVEAEDYDAHYDLGVAYKEMGLIDEAIAEFQKALRGPDHRVRSYEALGQCFVEKEQYPIAAALLKRATEVPGIDDQQLVGVLYLLGFATEHLGRPAEAQAYYLRVFAVDIEFRDVAARVAAMGNLTK